jgi:hypothetical protein
MLMNAKTQILNRLILTQAIVFSILFAIWMLPETILVRNLCLIIGALIGLYEIIFYRAQLFNKKSASLWLIFLLFIWATFHLLFLSQNFDLQYSEYLSIWKRSFLGALFSLGFGLGLANASEKTRKVAWTIFYIGLLLPTLIYIAKYSSMYYGQIKGVLIPEFWQIFLSNNSKFYIPKISYVGFCMPVLAAALGQLYYKIQNQGLVSWAGLSYLMTIPAVLFIFYVENIKNGIIYTFLLVIIFILLIVFKTFKAYPVRVTALLVVFVFASGALIKNHLEQNRSWQTLSADSQVAVKIEAYKNWQCTAVLGFPINGLGEQVSATNYERISWGLNAAKLIIERPLGFGLVERSFGAIGREKWPHSCLNQSHSGWLDLALGIGIPGLFLILAALILNIKNLYQLKDSDVKNCHQWTSMLSWVLLGLLFIWCTTEISQKIFFDELIFFIMLSSGYIAGGFKSSSKNIDISR